MCSSLRFAATLFVVCGATTAAIGADSDPSAIFEAGFRYRVVDQGTPQERAVCETVGGHVAIAEASTIPAPGGVALAGMAGLASMRRRRR